LIHRKQHAQVGQRIAFVGEVHMDHFRDHEGEGHQGGGEAECQEVLRRDRQFGQMNDQHGGPDDDGGEDKVQSFFLLRGAIQPHFF